MSRRLVVLVIVFLGALILRVYRLDQIPVSLYYDEVDAGLQARSLLTTGHDYRGELSPFYVHSFNEIRTPLPVYLAVVTTAVIKNPVLQVRLSNALMGTIACWLAALLIYAWRRNFTLTVITAAVFAVNPWQLQLSRYFHEAVTLAPFYLLGLIYFCKFLNSKKFVFYLGSIVSISLTAYTYRTMSLFAPLTLVLLGGLHIRALWALGWKKLAIAFSISALILGPFLYFTAIRPPDTSRFELLAVTSDPEVPIWVQRHREVDSGDLISPTLGKQAIAWSYFFHNKPLSWATGLVKNYLAAWSSQFLFTSGDINPRHSVAGRGELYIIDVIALAAGLFYLGSHRDQNWVRWLGLWLVTAPLPSVMTIDGGAHAGRLYVWSLPLLLIVAIGWWRVLAWGPKLLRLGWGLGLALSLVFYLHRYYVHYPLESARSWGYGFRQASETISGLQSQFDRVYLSPVKDPPMPYLLFWANIPPRQVQDHGPNFSQPQPGPLGKYTVLEWRENSVLHPQALYLVTPTEFPADWRDPGAVPKNINLHQVITYPDNEVAFYVLSLRPKE